MLFYFEKMIITKMIIKVFYKKLNEEITWNIGFFTLNIILNCIIGCIHYH